SCHPPFNGYPPSTSPGPRSVLHGIFDPSAVRASHRYLPHGDFRTVGAVPAPERRTFFLSFFRPPSAAPSPPSLASPASCSSLPASGLFFAASIAASIAVSGCRFAGPNIFMIQYHRKTNCKLLRAEGIRELRNWAFYPCLSAVIDSKQNLYGNEINRLLD